MAFYERSRSRGNIFYLSITVAFIVTLLTLWLGLLSYTTPFPAAPPHQEPVAADDDSHHESADIQNPENLIQLQPQFFTDLGSKRVQIKYGPFTVPGSGTNNGMKDFVDEKATKPCDDCLITYMRAGLQYPDGANANANTGMWLHHVVLLDTAVPDTVCPKDRKGRPVPNRFFASGNERTAMDLSGASTIQTGYFLSAQSQVVVTLELMNQMAEAREAVLTVEYEFIPSPIPKSFKHAKSIWLDIGGYCGNSEASVPNDTSTFDFNMQPGWKVPDGWEENLLVFLGGHLHDGGTHLEAMKSGGIFCDSAATYGANDDFIDGTGEKMAHISNMSLCHKATTLKAGDELSVKAYYDKTAHPMMVDADASLEPVMGIAILYAAQSEGGN
ncbi:hypothetical protein NA57DRAFT_51866 [Rhizodiscina lignyota]|uniref:Uncharacterized protein n=1 Tax=Rhizodiscina lignyota TaxID=1504668 RepID=A0A9P4MF44_9PEZI|nr:hypothetical protein NA57DRAFT_51866 [Rhizodiscina lignyota]